LLEQEIRRAIGRRIKECRGALSLSQIELAAALRVTPQAVSKWEKGDTMPSHRVWFDIAPVLGTSTDYLIRGVRMVPYSPSPMLARIFRPQECHRCAARQQEQLETAP
jgi:transcriptional regulator with XRE-family HTH domain